MPTKLAWGSIDMDFGRGLNGKLAIICLCMRIVADVRVLLHGAY